MTEASGAPAAPVTRRERVASALIVLGTVPMFVGLLDPLEGMFLIAAAGIAVAVAGFMRKSWARWLIVGGLALLVVTFLVMVAGQSALPMFVLPFTLVPWMIGGLLIIAGDILLLRQVVAVKRPRMANVVAVVLVLLVVLMTARIARALADYHPGEDMAMSARSTAQGDGVRLTLMLEDNPVDTEAAYWGAGVLENTSGRPMSLPPDTLLDVVVRDENGTVVWDAAQKFYGGGKPVMPWDRPAIVPVGGKTEQRWELHYPKPGRYRVSAEITSGPFAGLKTEAATVSVSAPPE